MKLFDTQKDILAIQKLEQEFQKKLPVLSHALTFHLMPPTGWINDPNGLCQKDGVYHIFFQYDPYSANGDGLKYWGHYETKDFIHYTYRGVFLSPDEPTDKDGVFSGCAMVDGDTMYCYYTGNVLESGSFDYTTAGRGSNTTLVTSPDGISAGKKECLLTSSHYPDNLSCHVRDPKVWKEDGLYYMVLGARTKKDRGCVMIYTSPDKRHFSFSQFIDTPDKFGYMWECPDMFTLQNQTFLSVSPQGVPQEEYKFQNVYQSGYFPLPAEKCAATKSLTFGQVLPERFTEWDMGFDFYAPQTFLDEQGRRILIGWIGNPDAPYKNPTIADGWQHTLTLPRELTLAADGSHILQNPVREIEALRSQRQAVSPDEKDFSLPMASELLVEDISDNDIDLVIDESILVSYKKNTGILSLSFLPEKECSKGHANGFGRTRRNVRLAERGLSHLRLFLDTSCLELYINGGEKVMTTRFYRSGDKMHHIHISDTFRLQAYALGSLFYERG